MKIKGNRITEGFLRGYLKNDNDLYETVNAWVDLSNAVGVIAQENEEDKFDVIRPICEEIDKEDSEIYEIVNGDDEEQRIFIYKTDEVTMMFGFINGFTVAVWNE